MRNLALHCLVLSLDLASGCVRFVNYNPSTTTDEPALKQAIARRLGLAVDKVGLPWVERKAHLEE